MSYYPREVSLEITATRLHKVIIETTRILLLREWRKGNPRKTARQSCMQHDKMGKSTVDGDALGIWRRIDGIG
jgi:hypothetical protein